MIERLSLWERGQRWHSKPFSFAYSWCCLLEWKEWRIEWNLEFFLSQLSVFSEGGCFLTIQACINSFFACTIDDDDFHGSSCSRRCVSLTTGEWFTHSLQELSSSLTSLKSTVSWMLLREWDREEGGGLKYSHIPVVQRQVLLQSNVQSEEGDYFLAKSIL